MANHTSGPWEAIENSWSTTSIVGSNRNTVCTLETEIDDDPEMRANARLIAAAPELLNALEDFVKACNIPGDTRLGVEVEMAFRQADALLERLVKGSA